MQLLTASMGEFESRRLALEPVASVRRNRRRTLNQVVGVSAQQNPTPCQHWPVIASSHEAVCATVAYF